MNNNQDVKIIPADFAKNNNSPEAQEFFRIDNNGNVDYFVKCGTWNVEDKNGNKYLYQRISFKVYPNIYSGNYNNNIEDFKNAIKNTAIKQINVAIYNPKKDDLNKNWENEEILKKDKINVGYNNITCKTIFDVFENNKIYKTITVNIDKLLIEVGARKELVECLQEDFGINLEKIRKAGECGFEDLGENEQQKYNNLQNKKNQFKAEIQKLNDEKAKLEKDNVKLQNENNKFKNANAQLDKKEQELKIKENDLKTKEEKLEERENKLNGYVKIGEAIYNHLSVEEKANLEKKQKKLEEAEKKLEDENIALKKDNELLKKDNELLKKNQQELNNKYVEIGKARIKDLDRTLKGTLYKKKDKGFFSIFGCCTCGLDNIAETEKKNEIN